MVFSFLKKNKAAALVTVTPDQGVWRALGAQVHYRRLHCDASVESGNLRLLPGGQVALCAATVEIEILLLEGALTVAGENYQTGDLCVLPAVPMLASNTAQTASWLLESAGGALCFMRRDVIKARIGVENSFIVPDHSNPLNAAGYFEAGLFVR